MFRITSSLSLFCLLGAYQISYLLRVEGFLIFSVGILLSLLALYCVKIVLKWSDVFFLLIPLSMLALSAILFIYSEDRDVQERYIVFYSSIQFLVLLWVAILSRHENTFKNMIHVLLIILMFELIVVYGQFMFLTAGVGFERVTVVDDVFGIVSGSLGNPNNSALFLGLICFVLTIYYMLSERSLFAIVILCITLPAIVLTLSRTMFLFWILNLLCVVFHILRVQFWSKGENSKYVIIAFLLGCTSTLFYFSSGGFDGISQLERSVVRIQSIGSLSSDESVGFRLTSHIRLIDSFPKLGVGSFVDQSYDEFFRPDDVPLMKVNPHSYIVEYSFLFGYVGFVFIGLLFLLLIFRIMSNSNLPWYAKLTCCIGLLAMQSVPSSLLTSAYFFVPFFLMGSLKFQVQRG